MLRINLTNLSGTLTTSDSFEFFKAVAFGSAFNQILPANPGSNLQQNVDNPAINGAAGGLYVLLGSANLTLPLSRWKLALANILD